PIDHFLSFKLHNPSILTTCSALFSAQLVSPLVLPERKNKTLTCGKAVDIDCLRDERYHAWRCSYGNVSCPVRAENLPDWSGQIRRIFAALHLESEVGK